MDEFKFLLWTVSSHILNDEKLALRVNSLAKASKIVEEEINSSGGIFNKPVRIIYREFSPQPEGYDEVIDFVNREESLVAMTGAGTQKIDDYILDKIDINNILYFTFLSDHKIIFLLQLKLIERLK